MVVLTIFVQTVRTHLLVGVFLYPDSDRQRIYENVLQNTKGEMGLVTRQNSTSNGFKTMRLLVKRDQWLFTCLHLDKGGGRAV